MNRLTATTALVLVISTSTWAQSEAHAYRVQAYGFGAFGTGLDLPHPLIEQLGFGGEGFLYKGLGVGGEAVWSHYNIFGSAQRAWIGSVGGSYHFRRHAPRGRADPFLIGGPFAYRVTSAYGQDVEMGWNFGGGVNLWVADHAALRFEVREHFNLGGNLPLGQGVDFPAVAFRIGVTFR
jgi:hypothetical protein